MKKLLTAIVALMLISPQADAFSLFGAKDKKNTKPNALKCLFIEKTSQIQEDNAQRREINEVKNVLCLLSKYSNEHNVDNIISLYDKKYKSFDGFDYETFKKMLKETFDAYKDIAYTSDIKSIKLYAGDKAVVNLVDTTCATLTSPKAKEAISKLGSSDLSTGYLEGECNYSIYLEKIDGKWKITGDNVIAETTSIKYGSANEVPMEFIAPIETPKGEDYCLSLKINTPEGTKAIASLGKEAIVYPSAEPKEAFRKIPEEKILERVVRANNEGLNEYAIASVGFTKIDVLEDFSTIRFQMTGLAFLMQRVNTYAQVNPLREVKKDAGEDIKKEVKEIQEDVED